MKVTSRKSLGGAAFLKDAENEAPPVPKPQKSKRYSTAFDLKAISSPKSNEEKKQQQIIAELYQDVVKRVQENKLTAKNAFGSRNIIDNLDVVLQLAKGNFHKASCAVSTAAEIYCLEVDDLSATTSLVQEMLFNSDKNRGEMDGEDARANRKKGESSSSNLTACCTLETNLSNIRSDQVEAELEIDAQFQKLLQGKDSGTQGMLLNILGVNDGPNLALDCTGVRAFPVKMETVFSATSNIEIPRDIISKAPRLVDSKIGPALMGLREELAKRTSGDSQLQVLSVVENLDPRMTFHSEISSKASSPTDEEKATTPPAPVDYDYDDYMDADSGEYYDDDSGMMSGPVQATGSSPISSSASIGGESKPSALPMIMKAFEEQAMGTDSGKVEFFEAPDVKMEATNKFWMGDVHWKAPRLRSVAEKVKEETIEKRKQARKKQNERLIDFFAAAPDEKILFAKPSSQRMNQLPRASLNKAIHVLPQNTHFTVADLRKLFLRPNMLIQPVVMSTDSTDVPLSFENDGEPSSTNEYDDGGGGFDDDYDDGNEFYDCETGLSPSKSSLVAPAHHVERIRVAYATRAKKVDVKKLKSDLWEVIDTMAVSNEEGKEPEMSLVGSIKEVAPKEQNDAITVPFYFICMLHLANEHGLELEGSTELDDIRIVKSC